MKIFVVLALVGVVSARRWYSAPGGGKYVVTYDNSVEFGGVRDTSVEYVRNVGDFAGAGSAGGPVSFKSAAANELRGSPFAMGFDSSEEVMFDAMALGDATGRTRADRVRQLTRTLNTGAVDFSDEVRFRSNLQRAAALGGKNYYINNSGELFYYPGAGAPQGAGPSPGGPSAAGSGVQVAK